MLEDSLKQDVGQSMTINFKGECLVISLSSEKRMNAGSRYRIMLMKRKRNLQLVVVVGAIALIAIYALFYIA